MRACKQACSAAAAAAAAFVVLSSDGWRFHIT